MNNIVTFASETIPDLSTLDKDPRLKMYVVETICQCTHLSADARFMWIWLLFRGTQKFSVALLEKEMACGTGKRRRMQRELEDDGLLRTEMTRAGGDFHSTIFEITIPVGAL